MITTYDLQSFAEITEGEPQANDVQPVYEPMPELRLETVAEAIQQEARAQRGFSGVIAGQVLGKV